MLDTELKESLESCSGCEVCFNVCPTYKETGDKDLSPMGRSEAARRIFVVDEITPEVVDIIYNCQECDACSRVCPWISFRLTIPEIVQRSKEELQKRGLAPGQAKTRKQKPARSTKK